MTEDLVTAAGRLAEVLAAENAALAALDLPRAGAMLAAKTRAADAFVAAHGMSHGASQGVSPGAGTAPPQRLRALLHENQRLLEHAITVQGRVIGVIARALPRALRDPVATRYGAQGRAAPARLSAVAVSARA
jgi:hypothetical protein